VIARNLQVYEDEHFFIGPRKPPLMCLNFLMEKHGLIKGNLPEIGIIAGIKNLKGERK